MSSLVREFQRDIVQSTKSTTELLRTAKLISVKLGLSDIGDWINSELTGYQHGIEIPPYRGMSGGSLQVLNPYRGWQPVGQLKQTFNIAQPVSELEELSNSKSIVVPLTRDMHYRVGNDMGMDISDWQQQIEIPTIQLRGLLSAIRDKLLDWSLELEKRGILGENMSFDEKERQSAQSQVFHIQNLTGVAGNISNSSVQIFDYGSIHQTLKQQNVPQPERNELENILDKLRTATPAEKPSLLEKGKAWVVKNEAFLGASATIIRKVLGLES
jgi:hypothetical protein